MGMLYVTPTPMPVLYPSLWNYFVLNLMRLKQFKGCPGLFGQAQQRLSKETVKLKNNINSTDDLKMSCHTAKLGHFSLPHCCNITLNHLNWMSHGIILNGIFIAPKSVL